MEAKIVVKDKVATGDNTVFVCDNTDYTIKFDFDEEWSAESVKTARFIYNDQFQEVVFEGDTCAAPAVTDTIVLAIGVYAGNLRTTTPAFFNCATSVLRGSETHSDPPQDVYDQLIELWSSKSDSDAVRFTEQTLTDEQKAQARENIGAAAGSGGTSGKAWAEILNTEVEEATAIFTLSDLGGLTDILILWRGLINAAANAGGYVIEINSIPITDSSAVPVAKAGTAGGYGNTRLHYNGLYWEVLKSNGGSSATLKNVNQANTLNNLTMGVGACEALLFRINATDRAAVSGNLTVYGR